MRRGIPRRHALAPALLILLVCAPLSDAVSASSEDAQGAVAIAPAAPVQGDTLAIVIAAPRGAAVRVRFDGRTAPAYPLPAGAQRALVGTDPTTAVGRHSVTVSWRQAGSGPISLSRAVRLGRGRFGVRALDLPPTVFGLITPQNAAVERRALVAVLSRRTPEALWTGPFVAPSAGTMDSAYGLESVYNGHREWWHQGMDYEAAEGDPVAASNAGLVALAQRLPLGGNTIVLDHGQGVLSEYIHLSGFAVAAGQRVARGDTIGRVGATGLVTGPSLHWGLCVDGTWVNPRFWMAPRPGLTQ